MVPGGLSYLRRTARADHNGIIISKSVHFQTLIYYIIILYIMICTRDYIILLIFHEKIKWIIEKNK